MSEFGGLSIALSSLQTQQRALEIAANNVAEREHGRLHAPGRRHDHARWIGDPGDLLDVYR